MIEVLDIDLDGGAETWADIPTVLAGSSGWTYRDYQVKAFDAIDAAWAEGLKRILLVLATGLGKCLGKGTPVLMFDGTIKAVEGVVVGDLLMGPDSKPRRVLSLARGQEQLYRVTPIKGDSYVVNESHILSLRMTTGKRRVTLDERAVNPGEIVNLAVRDYLGASKNFRHCAKGWRSPVDFPSSPTHPDMPPYMLGLWLGDGATRGTGGIATMDHEIRGEICDYANKRGLYIRHERALGKCDVIHVTTMHQGSRGNHFTRALRDLGVVGNKHVPHSYKANDRTTRLEVLAGLIDSDGSLADGTCYDFISEKERLADDVCFLARSLGLAAYKSPQRKTCQNGNGGIYYRVCISGDTHEIPVRIGRKKAALRRQKKNVLNTGIKVTPEGVGDYYGFEIDGDRLFMLGDFTVTHNTVVFTHVARKVVAAGGKVLIIAHSEELLDQAAEKLRDSTGLEAVKEKAGERASPFDSVVVASVQTLSRASRLQGWAKDHFDLIIIDETHRAAAKSYMTIINHFTSRLLGVTATADRGDGQTLGHIYEKCVFEFGLLEAVRGGWLVRPIVKTLPLEIDLKGVKTSRTSQGSDYDLTEVSHRIEPFLGEIARLMAENTRDRKQGIIFMPSVDTARMMRDALQAQGLNAEFVSGECSDRTEKIEAFKAGRTSILINAMLLIEGFDHDAVDWISVLRPTKIRGLYVQAVGRGTRTLKHIIPALNATPEPEARRALIAKSAKPTLLILDFLWLTEKLDLIAPVSLVCKDPRIAEMAAKKSKDGDLLDIEALAQRDLLKSLEKAAAKNAGKKAKTLDPLALAVSLKQEDLAHYTPSEKWEYAAPSKPQLDALAHNKIDVSQVHTAGMAAQILNRLHLRRQQGLCSVPQMTFMEKHGVTDAAWKTAAEAKRFMMQKISGWKLKKPSSSTRQPDAHANQYASLPLT